MRRKMIGIIILATIFLGAAACAQEWPDAIQIIETVQKDLNLDQKQLSAVTLIIESNMARREQLWAESGSGPTLAQSEELRSDLYSRLREVLTRAQMSRCHKIIKTIEENADAADAANCCARHRPGQQIE